ARAPACACRRRCRRWIERSVRSRTARSGSRARATARALPARDRQARPAQPRRRAWRSSSWRAPIAAGERDEAEQTAHRHHQRADEDELHQRIMKEPHGPRALAAAYRLAERDVEIAIETAKDANFGRRHG